MAEENQAIMEEAKEAKAEHNPSVKEKTEAKKEEAKHAEAKPVKEKVKEAKQEKETEAKQEAEEKEPLKKKKRLSKKRGLFTKSKKKHAVARAIIRKGTGKISINKKSLNLISPFHVLEYIREPIYLAGEGNLKEIDIVVNFQGGGFMSQAVAARSAIAKGLVGYLVQDKKLKEQMLKYDRMLLVDDSRRKEPKKQLGRGARAKKQLSRR